MPPKNLSWADIVSNSRKHSSKIVFNLKDVNKAPELICKLPLTAFYKCSDNTISLYMVYHAQLIVELHNYFLNLKSD